MTPEQALENLARVADAALLNGPDRRVVDQSIVVLNALVAASKQQAQGER